MPLANLIFESPLSSLKLARIAALSFCTTALSSAIVFEARTLRMNCFTDKLLAATFRGCLVARLTGAHIDFMGTCTLGSF